MRIRSRLFASALLLALLCSNGAGAAPKPPLPDDVMASVEGKPITRRELTYLWINTDGQARTRLGMLLSDHWSVSLGKAGRYTVTDADVYQTLYGDHQPTFSTILSNMVTTRLAAIEAKRRKLVIKEADVQARAHAILEGARQNQNLKTSDAATLKIFRIKPDLFMEDVRYQLNAQALFSAELNRRLGHAPRPDDWLQVRTLATYANQTNGSDTEEMFTAARKRLDAMVQKVNTGASMETVASQQNEDFTKQTGGLRIPSLRGLGRTDLETQIWKLPAGTLSAPIRLQHGWYVFRVERKGEAITLDERNAIWQQIKTTFAPATMLTLRRRAHVKSVVELPITPLQPHLPLAIDDEQALETAP